MKYKLEFLIDTYHSPDRVRVRWIPSPVKGGKRVETNFIVDTIHEYLEDFDAVEKSYFTRYTALLDVAVHITTIKDFKEQLKDLIERDIVKRIENNSQLQLAVEVSIL